MNAAYWNTPLTLATLGPSDETAKGLSLRNQLQNDVTSYIIYNKVKLTGALIAGQFLRATVHFQLVDAIHKSAWCCDIINQLQITVK